MERRRFPGVQEQQQTEATMLRAIGCVVLILIAIGLLVVFGVLDMLF